MARFTSATKTKSRVSGNRQILPVEVGPWPLGLNNREGDFGFRDIKPTELLTCSNFDILESGILENRPGFVRYDTQIFQATLGLLAQPITLRNVIGSVRLDAAYDEALIQLENINTNDIYILKNSVTSGEFSDFAPGYWIKKAVVAGEKFYLTSVLRYFEDVYLTTNNSLLNEVSTFTGGFFYGTPLNNYLANIFKSGLVDSFTCMTLDSSDNLYFGVDTGTSGKIVKITSSGVVTDFATTVGRVRGIACDLATNTIYSVGFGSSFITAPIFKITSSGAVTTFVAEDFSTSSNFKYWSVSGLTIGNNKLFAIELESISSSTIRYNVVSFDLTSSIKTIIYSGPIGDGNLVADSLYHDGASLFSSRNGGISKLDSNGITTLYFSTDTTTSGVPTAPQFAFPPVGTPGTQATSINKFFKDSAGDWIYLDSITNGNIYKLTPSSVVSILSGTYSSGIVGIDSLSNLFIYEPVSNKITKLSLTTAPTLIPIVSMPFGDLSFMFKDRMWIINKTTNRIYYSKATDPTDWNTADGAGFFDVNPGDGLTINDVVVANNQMFIFKDTGTWRFTFTADPGVDGILGVISHDRGAYSATVYNNVVYLVGTQGVQKLINGFFIDISQQIKHYHKQFSFNSIIDNLENRLLVTLKSSDLQPAHMLVMNLLSGSWSTYNLDTLFPTTPLPVKNHIFNCGNQSAVFLGQNGSKVCVGAINNISSDNAIMNLGGFITTHPSIYHADDIETSRYLPAYSMNTMYYDFNTPLNWKKLTKLSVDLISNFFDYLTSTVTYPIKLTLNFRSPKINNTATMQLNTSNTSPELGPDQFPVMQSLYDLSTNQAFSAHRFQVISFNISTDILSMLSPGNKSKLVIKKLSAFITQKTSKGDDIFVG